MRNTLFYGVIVAALLTVGYFLVPKNESVVANGESVNREEVESIVREFIMENPQLIIESVTKYNEEQQRKAAEEQSERLKTLHQDLSKNTTSPIAGNKDGDVLVVEFFDYNCGYCKRAVPTIQKLLDDDKNVKVMFKEFPILSPQSQTAARVALAVNAVDSSKYFEFHTKLMQGNARTEDAILDIAKGMGLDVEAVKAKMNSDEVNKELEAVRQLAGQVGVNGTPAFVVGDQLIPGAVGIDRLKAAIAEQRKK